jgi:putative transposase
MERKITFAPKEYYHVYNRGVNKMKTFMNPHDYWRFIFLLFLCNDVEPVKLENITRNELGLTLLKMQEKIFKQERGESIVDIGAFCLMPNHFHILLRERVDGGVPKFMQKISTAYTMYVNKRHGRTGALFGGSFKAEHVTDDVYLKYLFAYIHLNPVKLIDPEWKENGIHDKKRAQKYLDEYEYSSYGEYTKGDSPLGKILTKDSFPHYFTRNADFKTYIDDWLSYTEPL